jgi:hypothetical protein
MPALLVSLAHFAREYRRPDLISSGCAATAFGLLFFDA